MPGYFSQFPTLFYPFQDVRDLQGMSGKQQVTYTLARVKFLDALQNNIAVYYEYDVQDGETPEIIADKYYGDPTLHWVILLANNIVNPYFDWPLESRVFEKYLIEKYGSVEESQLRVHHYEKVIVRLDSVSQIETTSRMIIDADTFADTPVSTVEAIDLRNGTTVHQTTTTETIYCFEWEISENEAKRRIKLVKKDHLSNVLRIFDNLMSATDPTIETS